jgi:hypothetical protein
MAYLDLTDSFNYKDPLLWKDLDVLAENDLFLKENGWQNGDKTVFFQATAPTGWTKDSTAALDGKVLRVVSGSGAATGGTTPIASGITLAHTHSISNQAAHTHSVTHAHLLDTTAISDGSTLNGDVYYSSGNFFTGGSSGTPTVGQELEYTSNNTQTSGSDGAHDHGGTSGSALSNITLAYVDVIVCSKDSSSGYDDVTEEFSYGLDLDNIFDVLNDLGDNDEFNRLRLIEAASVSVFGQATTPTGWTKLTAQDNKAVRIVTGSGGGAGGSHGFGTEITLAHSAHSITAGGVHSHTLASHSHTIGFLTPVITAVQDEHFVLSGGVILGKSGGGVSFQTRASGNYDSVTGAVDSEADHQHTLQSSLSNQTLAYFNVCYGSKDSTPNEYDDYSAFFSDDALLAWQDLDQLALNDDYILFHQLPATSAMFFYMAAAPDGWTKTTDQNDKGLRIVSGVGGSAGGSVAMSAGLTLAHTHTIDNFDHNHGVTSHTHTLTTAGTNQFNAANDKRIVTGGASRKLSHTGTGATARNAVAQTAATIDSETVATDSHAHGGATGSGLSNLTLAYADVIKCTKD